MKTDHDPKPFQTPEERAAEHGTDERDEAEADQAEADQFADRS